MKNWIEQLQPIIDEYKDGSDEPLDGDEVDRLCEIIKEKINLHEGNITEEDILLDEPNGDIPLIELPCLVEVEYTDLKGVKRTAIIEHNGESDCWFGIEDAVEDIAFDFNTFGGTEYSDKRDSFLVSAYQCMVKRDGYWTMDDAIQLECKIIKINPK